ncbi:MAG TPA: LON peptidase substrate-binding domain-containing protein, partial [Magnetospirillum sp.]|nr:LON peptidase substrate-binding domain-containing protein [Magnetospirillum sp.]
MGAATTELPRIVPVFALSGALLLPGARLPLTVFEPRYLALIDAALGAGRLFGLVQPAPANAAGGDVAGLYGVGTLARITAFGETGDRRYLITATGVTRFRLVSEVEGRAGYRRVVAEYGRFAADLAAAGVPERSLDRRRLMAAVSTYMTRQGVALDLGKLEKATDGEFVTSLAMAAPLSPEEKQALLEAPGLADRADLMTALFEMALLAEAGQALLH